MEPSYNDPNYWTRWYDDQQELLRARQESDNEPADQAGFEQQLGELQLGFPEESSAELSSPDTRPAKAHDGIPRTDVGGSMWMPPLSNLRDNSFNSTRYTAPSEPEPVARTRNKSGGLFSRVKSGLGKGFGGSRDEKSIGGPASDVVYSELRIDCYKRSRASEEDAALLSEFARAAAGRYAPSSIQKMVEHLGRFSDFLKSNNLTLASLLENPIQLKAHANEFVNAGGIERVHTALEALRKSRAGELLSPPPFPPPLTGDALLIHQYAAAARAHNVPGNTFRTHTDVLTHFAEWLTAKQKPSLTSRFRTDELAEDIMAYGEENDHNGRLFTALNHLRRLQPDGGGFETLGPGPRVIGRRTLSAYESDAGIIDGATDVALGRLGPESTAKERAPILNVASNQRRLSDWLKREGRESIESRLNGSEEQEKQLQKDISEFKRDIGYPAISLGINNLRGYLRGELQHGLHPRRLHPYDDDASIIDGVAKEQLSKLGSDPASQSKKKDVRNTASAQRSFSDWLRTTGRESIVSRINGNDQQQRSLNVDYREFTQTKRSICLSLNKLLNQLGPYLRLVEANRALGVAFPERPSQESPLAGSSLSWPRVPSDFDPSEWLPLAPAWSPRVLSPSEFSLGDLPTPPDFGPSEWLSLSSDYEASMRPIPEAAPARSSEIYRGLNSLVDLPSTPQNRTSEIYRGLDSLVDLPSTPQEMRDDAQSALVPSSGVRSPFFIGPSGAPQELEDIGHLVGRDWQHGSQPVPDLLVDVLDNRMLLPNSRIVPQPVSINGETYSIMLGPRGCRDAQFIHHPRPSSAPDAQIGALATGASSSRDRSGRVLDAQQWLGDEHIQRDYELLAQELGRSHPNLATRTRFVDPLIAFQLSHGADTDALRALHRLVDDRNGNDIVDFLFLPVSDASPTDRARRGEHWSLLLVDRRDRERPVAYHYDSAPGFNDRPAGRLVERLGANLQAASMRRQNNGYDCGVFVVDGTRALVSRLAVRRQVDVNLDNLVVDRRALQNRLRG
ncbi:Ulp1 family isopeptidase [Bradyrhizobium sp. sBnM-33]|uniref:Ulp1 family isopeptidase n=1 Tax=Bradyrhizobium sp. sBnM-33 TaxID=2831780 RepID=UPI001BD01BA6|nr:Ulp1 family isopeptidase [Bradyrhizobium sp. sBnM-33]WOH52671.1 Ulp1 family isopeptidase [Bradyrhizobium sp. sBnM-33]